MYDNGTFSEMLCPIAFVPFVSKQPQYIGADTKTNQSFVLTRATVVKKEATQKVFFSHFN